MMKTTFTGKGRLSLLVLLTGLLCLTAPKAQAQPQDSEEKDPPSRVARLSYLEGNVSLQPGGEGDWGSAAKNRPVTIGDKIWSDKDSRVELQAGQAAIHVGQMTSLSFLNLDQTITQIRLPEGSINFRVRELREGDLYEVDTPNLAFTVKEAGAFRLDVSETGDATRVTVLRGEGEVTAGGKTYQVHGGESAEVNGTDNDVQYNVNEAPASDGLDQWAAERDLKEENSVSAKYVSRDTVGYSDLDDNGSWRDEPEYGHVWYPRNVEPDWAPYSSGSWNYVGPWGWTWVDYEPWGFAPFHYGRWNYIGGSWGWCPGPVYGYPVYGPAFVGFLGDGFSVGFGGGFGVGWFPLGFGEPFFPWFHCRHEFFERINTRNTFIRNTNVLNTTNIHNTNFVNAHNVRAVTATSRAGFVGGQAVNRASVHVTAAALSNAKVTTGAGLSPTHQSFGGAISGRARVSVPSSTVQNRAVMARTAPAPGAAHQPVRTINASSLAAGGTGNSSTRGSVGRPVNAQTNHSFGGATNGRPVTGNAPGNINRPSTSPTTPANTSRQGGVSQNRPPSVKGVAAGGARTWAAQGNVTDRGHAPQSFGSANQPANGPANNNSVQSTRMIRNDRPPWAGTPGGSSNGGNSPAIGRNSSPSFSNRPSPSSGNRSYTPPARPSTTNNNNRSYSPQQSPPARSYTPPSRSDSAPRSYTPPSHSYSAPSRSYSAPSRSYTPPARSYSAPSQSYSAPSRSYSAPSRSYTPPARSYSAPSYSAPSRSYSAPSRSYSAPSHSYSAPSHSYSAPSHSAGGGGGSNGGGGGGSAAHGRH